MKSCCVLLSVVVNLLLSEIPVAVQGLPICLTGNTSIEPTADVKMFGEITKYDDKNRFELTCFSCLMPHAEGVDLYVNNVMKDSIRYLDGICYHKLKACRQERCTCSAEGKHFTWIFKSYLSYLHFTCVMRFNDDKLGIVIRKANWIYDARDFNRSKKTSISTSNLDKTAHDYNLTCNDKNQGNNSDFKHSKETSISTSNSDKTAHDYNLTGNDKDEGNNSGYIGYSVLGSLGLIIGAVVALFACQICTLGKKKAMKGDYIICGRTSLDTSLSSIYSNDDCTDNLITENQKNDYTFVQCSPTSVL